VRIFGGTIHMVPHLCQRDVGRGADVLDAGVD
jgi:hypothetical protein